MLGLSLMMAMSLAVSPEETACSSLIGEHITLSTFADVRSRLPLISPRTSYESTADYERRLAQTAAPGASRVVVRRHPNHPGEGLSYDPDRQILTVYDTAFGAGQINFSSVFGREARASDDNFTGAIGFQVGATETGQDTYEATNAYGARVPVTRTERQVDAVWERVGRRGESQFVGVGSYRPVARIPMAPDSARDLIEGGAAALLFVPKTPFQASGTSVLEPSFSRPRERRDTINVIIADVQCAFLLNGAGIAMYAFTVK